MEPSHWLHGQPHCGGEKTQMIMIIIMVIPEIFMNSYKIVSTQNLHYLFLHVPLSKIFTKLFPIHPMIACCMSQFSENSVNCFIFLKKWCHYFLCMLFQVIRVITYVMLLGSESNMRRLTLDGVDVMGERLAKEVSSSIRQLVPFLPT